MVGKGGHGVDKGLWVAHVEALATQSHTVHACALAHLVESRRQLYLALCIGILIGSLDVGLQLFENFWRENVLSEDGAVFLMPLGIAHAQKLLGIARLGLLVKGGHTERGVLLCPPTRRS